MSTSRNKVIYWIVCGLLMNQMTGFGIWKEHILLQSKTRRFIDDINLPDSNLFTRWTILVPRKVNILLWCGLC